VTLVKTALPLVRLIESRARINKKKPGIYSFFERGFIIYTSLILREFTGKQKGGKYADVRRLWCKLRE
jgi:hypothetical protein